MQLNVLKQLQRLEGSTQQWQDGVPYVYVMSCHNAGVIAQQLAVVIHIHLANISSGSSKPFNLSQCSPGSLLAIFLCFLIIQLNLPLPHFRYSSAFLGICSKYQSFVFVPCLVSAISSTMSAFIGSLVSFLIILFSKHDFYRFFAKSNSATLWLVLYNFVNFFALKYFVKYLWNISKISRCIVHCNKVSKPVTEKYLLLCMNSIMYLLLTWYTFIIKICF